MSSWFPIFVSGNAGNTTFATTKIGAGGWVVGINIATDGTKVCRADSYGGYWYNTTTLNSGNANRTGAWQQFITQSSMPAADQYLDYATNRGVLEVRICDSNTNHFYMLWSPNESDVFFYSSTDRGATWTKSSTFTSFTGDANGPFRTSGAFIAIDPANENTVFAGSPSTGVQRSLNGGSTWNAVPTVGSSNGQWSIVAFDPTTTSGGNTPGIYIFTNGTGLYHSTDTGASSSLIASSPTSCLHMIVDQSGVVWVVSGTGQDGGTLNRYNGAWTTFGSQSAGQNNAVAVSPGNANVAYLMTGGGAMWVTLDAAATTPTWAQLSTVARNATDIPWLQNTKETFMSAGDICFDPVNTKWSTSASINSTGSTGQKTFVTLANLNLATGTIVTVYRTSDPTNRMQGTVDVTSSGTSLVLNITAGSGSAVGATDWTVGTTKLYFSEGIGVWFSNPPVIASQTLNWNSESTAIEQLVPRWIISPWGVSSVPIFTTEDRAFVRLNNPLLYPSHQGINDNGSTAIQHGWSADWAGQSPLNLVAMVSGGSGKSSDGGANWALFGSNPLGFTGNSGGTLSIAATTVNNLVWLQANNNGSYRSGDGGATWTLIDFTANSLPMAGALTPSINTPLGGPITFSSVPSWLSTSVTNFGHYEWFTATSQTANVTGTTATTVTIAYQDQTTDNTTSHSIVGSGTLVWTTAAAMGLGDGTSVTVWQTSNSANFMVGTVTTGGNVGTNLSLSISSSGGSGAGITNWTMAPTGLIITPATTDAVLFRPNSGFNNTGWGSNGSFNAQRMAADRVTDNTFYAFNQINSTLGGIYRTSDAGATWTHLCNPISNPTTCPAGNQSSEFIRSVPNHAGHLWFTAGANTGPGGHPASVPFWRSTDGGATWSIPNANVKEVWSFGFGKADPSGAGYPTIYIYGWVTTIDGTYAGIYRSTDEGASWTRLSRSGIAGQFPNGSLDSVAVVDGDANIYGTVYVGFGGSGWATGTLS